MTSPLLQMDLLRQIADSQSSRFAIQDPEQRYLLINEPFAQAMGLPADRIIGRTDRQIERLLGNDVDRSNARARAGDDQDKAEMCARPAGQPDTIRTPLVDAEGREHAWLIQSGDSVTVRALRRTLKECIETREDQLSVLNGLMSKMMAFQELDPLLQHIAETMIRLTVATNALILLVDETEEFIQVVASAGSHSSRNIGERREHGVGFAGLAWKTAQPQYLRCSDAHTSTKGFWPAGTQLLAVPLLADGAVIGVAVLGAEPTEKDFSTSIALVDNLAHLAGIAIASAQSMEQSRSELRRMRALGDISRQLASFDDANELIPFVSRALVDAMDIDRSSGYRVSSTDTLETEVVWIRDGSDVVPGEPVPATLTQETICQWCVDNNAFARIGRDEKDARESSRLHELRMMRNVGSTLCMPITSGRQALGALLVTRDRSRRNFDENEIYLFQSIANQLSSALYGHEMSTALRHQAYHDSLTQLPNRRRFETALKHLLTEAADTPSLSAVMFLDLDGFKSVNDTLGHAVGDELLQHVAKRLERCLKNEDLLARIGGDEFAVLLGNIASRTDAMSVGERLRDSLTRDFRIGDATARIGTSVGISVHPVDGYCADDLLRAADEAMYQAKAGGKNRVVCFHRDMAIESRKRTRLEAELREAIEGRQFLLHYQPQLDARTGRVEGLEALIRWDHPARGLISPGEFIPVAEESGMISAIGRWVLGEAVAQLSAWKGTLLENRRVSVNVAASQFLLEDFCSDVLTPLEQHDVSPALLELEMTESMVMTDVPSVIRRLETLRAIGVRVAIDDFGTGYSSLSCLQELPLDVLKIDRSFVDRLPDERVEHSLVNTIMLLAKGLGLETVAEGVETAAQLDQITRLGCTLVQGFHVARPCGAADLPGVIERIENGYRSAA